MRRLQFVFVLLVFCFAVPLALSQPMPQRQQPLPQRTVPNIHLPQAPPPCGEADCDGDGHNNPAHGGDDCDDSDGRRYPGNHEVADTVGHDEDCEASTIGVLDEDQDGFTSNAIFNRFDGKGNGLGMRIGDEKRGDDCDDHQPQIRPSAQELPNHIDDNCDGLVDNLLGDWYTPPPRPH